MERTSVDAVILWVDGADPKHGQKLNYYKSINEIDNLRKDAVDDTRFFELNEVYYCIKSVRKYAKWISTIYLITDQQKPSWLTSNVAKKLKVKVVDHSEVFRDDQDLLPVFNSTSIECYIQNIKGLSDNFIYLNDDFFFIKKTNKHEYIDDRLKIRGAYYFKGLQRILSLFPSQSKLDYSGLNSFRGGIGSYKGFFPFQRAHAPMVLNKVKLMSVFSDSERRENSKFKFRSNEQVNPIDICFNKMLEDKTAKVGSKDWAYISPAQLKGRDINQELSIIQGKKYIKSLCIQDLMLLDAKTQKSILSFLEKIIISD